MISSSSASGFDVDVCRCIKDAHASSSKVHGQSVSEPVIDEAAKVNELSRVEVLQQHGASFVLTLPLRTFSLRLYHYHAIPYAALIREDREQI